jgi:hypothetical protein
MLQRPPKSQCAPSASPATERSRRARARRRAGRAVYQVEITGEVLDLAVRLGYANERELSDRHAVEAALSRMLADAAKR